MNTYTKEMLPIQQHIYWKQKVAFQLSEDIDKNWIAFAIEKGEFYYEIAAKKGEAIFGDIIICPPNTIFKREIITPLTFHFFRFTCSDYQPTVGKISIKDYIRLNSSYSHLRMLTFNEPSKSNEWKSHLLYDLCLLHDIEVINDKKLLEHKRPQDMLIHNARKYITDNAYNINLQIKDIAFTFGLSPVQFTRRFQVIFNINPSEYLTLIRLQKAKALLLETNDTIENIADQCGYTNGFYLSRKFSNKMNISPSEYRKTGKI